MLSLCTSLYFYNNIAHEYAKVDGKIAAVGITDYAQTALGDIVYVDLPEVGDEFEAGESFASVESVKAASDVYCPVGGTIVEINETLTDQPDLVNESPEDDAWFVKIEMEESADPTTLMTAEQYKAYVEEADSS